MCTVSFVPHSSGYQLGMNRDEQRTRVRGIFPPAQRMGAVEIVGPTEPTGGRWVVCNSHGVTLALLNWYSRTVPSILNPYSRGDLTRSLAFASDPGEVIRGLEKQPLDRVRPFRLVMVVNRSQSLFEWRWAGEHLEERRYPWADRIWASSGYDETAANVAREQVFKSYLKRSPRSAANELFPFHQSHEPERGAFSVCMHREEAATVSYTEVSVSDRSGCVRYIDGAPCQSTLQSALELRFEVKCD